MAARRLWDDVMTRIWKMRQRERGQSDAEFGDRVPMAANAEGGGWSTPTSPTQQPELSPQQRGAARSADESFEKMYRSVEAVV